MKELDKLNQLSESHGELRPGSGMISGVIALSLAILCFLGVLAFHWPEYLTTPQLRKSYNVDVMRQLLFWSLVIAGGLSLFNIVRARARWLALGAFVLIGLSLALGGHKVPVDSNLPDNAFGTAVKSDREWPEHYGVVGDYVPNGFFKQLAFPFTWKA
jgi:hypothetical protein